MNQVCIYEEADYINTLSVKELLDTSGLITYMPNENMGTLFSPGVFGSGMFKILVPENQVDQALICPLCGSDNVTEKKLSRFILFMFFGPLLTSLTPMAFDSTRIKKKCKNCQHRWI